MSELRTTLRGRGTHRIAMHGRRLRRVNATTDALLYPVVFIVGRRPVRTDGDLFLRARFPIRVEIYIH